MLLAGLALESLAKGIIIGRNPEYIEKDKDGKLGLSRKITTHDIPRLVDMAFKPKSDEPTLYELSPQEKEICTYLKEYVIWQGKYPISLTENKYKHAPFSLAYAEIVSGIYDRLEQMLLKEHPNPSVHYA